MAVGMEKCRLSGEILGGTHGEKLATVWAEEGRAWEDSQFQAWFAHAESEMPETG